MKVTLRKGFTPRVIKENAETVSFCTKVVAELKKDSAGLNDKIAMADKGSYVEVQVSRAYTLSEYGEFDWANKGDKGDGFVTVFAKILQEDGDINFEVVGYKDRMESPDDEFDVDYADSADDASDIIQAIEDTFDEVADSLMDEDF